MIMNPQVELWPPSWNPLDIAYFAGFFDGEGSVGIYYTHRIKGPSCRISLCNNDPRPLQKALELFGGKIRPRFRKFRADKCGIRNNWEWYAWGKQAEKFLLAVLPHLLIKKNQAEIYLTEIGRARVGKEC